MDRLPQKETSLIKIARIAPLYDRLWRRVKRGRKDECWEWQGYKTILGYGQIGCSKPKKKILYCHRVAWESVNGPIPEGIDICHKCDNPRCCNPSHLFAGTHEDNMRDCHAKKRSVHFIRPDCFPTGEKSCRSKLKKHQVIQAMKMVSRGLPAWIIAEEFGVSRSAISKIANGKSWRKELSKLST
jgi:hypothetical protein